MIVTHLQPGLVTVRDRPERPAGLHVSQIIKSLCQHLDPVTYGQPMDMVKVDMGLKFEEVLETAFASGASSTFRPDPILVPPGIWCSPDGVDPEISPWAVEEFKLTWYSASKDCPQHPVYWPWLVQIKAYCHALETRYAKLWVLHINGDYKPPRPWPPKVMGLEFSAMEIAENWSMLVTHAQQRGWL